MERWCALLKADSPEEKGLAVSGACWTTYMFRTAAPVCQHRRGTNPLCSHYLPEFFFFFLAFPLCGNLCSCSCLSLYSFHVSYHTFDLCLLFAGAWKSTTMSRQGWWFECCTGKENLHQFHSFGLNWSISWDIHLKGFSAGPVFGWKCILDLNER